MSGVRKEFSLEQTLPQTDAVVVAVPADPPRRYEEINIAPDGAPPSEEFPAYREQYYRYRVEESLLGDLKPGSEIEVKTSSGVTLEAHRLYHVEKVRKILPYDHYESSMTPEDLKGDPRRILLLRGFGEGGPWHFARDVSEEPLRLRKKIERLLHGRMSR